MVRLKKYVLVCLQCYIVSSSTITYFHHHLGMISPDPQSPLHLHMTNREGGREESEEKGDQGEGYW